MAPPGKSTELHHSGRTFGLEATWKMDAAFLAREIDLAELSSARPISKGAQRRWLLATLRAYEDAGGTLPTNHPDRRSQCPAWTAIVRQAQNDGLLELQGGKLSLAPKGREEVLNNETPYPDGLPDDPPLRVHIGAIATIAAVQVDAELFARLQRVVRTTLAAEMEGAAIAHVADKFERRAIVVKAVSDHADFDKDDSFRKFACRASAEVLLALLLKHLDPEPEPFSSAPDLNDRAPDVNDGSFDLDDGSDRRAGVAVGVEHVANDETQPNPAPMLKSLLAKVQVLKHLLTEGLWGRLCRNAPRELLETWVRLVESAPNDRGAAAPLVAAMWREAVHLNVVPYVLALDGRIDRNLIAEIYREKKTSWVCLAQQKLCDVGPRARAREAEFGWTEDAWDRPHAVAGPLFELMWDVLYYLYTDEMRVGPFKFCWWSAAGGSVDPKSPFVFSWPLVDFSCFSVYEDLAARWNQEYSRTVKIHILTPNDDAPVDDLAYWYVAYHHLLWHEQESPISMGPAENWTTAVKHLIESAENPRRDGHPFAEWVRALPLLAAPESGLSRNAASAILAGTKLDDSKRKDLRELRYKRVRDCLPGQSPGDVLATLDSDYSDHPWMDQVEKPLRAL